MQAPRRRPVRVRPAVDRLQGWRRCSSACRKPAAGSAWSPAWVLRTTPITVEPCRHHPIRFMVFSAVFNGIAALPLLWIINRIASDRRAMGAVGGHRRVGVLPGTAPDSRWPAHGSAVFPSGQPSQHNGAAEPAAARREIAQHLTFGLPVRPTMHIHTPHRRCSGQRSPLDTGYGTTGNARRR